jgi:hypothetical protein
MFLPFLDELVTAHHQEAQTDLAELAEPLDEPRISAVATAEFDAEAESAVRPL